MPMACRPNDTNNLLTTEGMLRAVKDTLRLRKGALLFGGMPCAPWLGLKIWKPSAICAFFLCRQVCCSYTLPYLGGYGYRAQHTCDTLQFTEIHVLWFKIGTMLYMIPIRVLIAVTVGLLLANLPLRCSP